IAEVERRASSLALPRCSNVIEDNGKEKDPETGFLYYGARYHWPEVFLRKQSHIPPNRYEDAGQCIVFS
ncbi:MAG: hypothetical protein AUK63_1601, partial [bacterium P3]